MLPWHCWCLVTARGMPPQLARREVSCRTPSGRLTVRICPLLLEPTDVNQKDQAARPRGETARGDDWSHCDGPAPARIVDFGVPAGMLSGARAVMGRIAHERGDDQHWRRPAPTTRENHCEPDNEEERPDNRGVHAAASPQYTMLQRLREYRDQTVMAAPPCTRAQCGARRGRASHACWDRVER